MSYVTDPETGNVRAVNAGPHHVACSNYIAHRSAHRRDGAGWRCDVCSSITPSGTLEARAQSERVGAPSGVLARTDSGPFTASSVSGAGGVRGGALETSSQRATPAHRQS